MRRPSSGCSPEAANADWAIDGAADLEFGSARCLGLEQFPRCGHAGPADSAGALVEAESRRDREVFGQDEAGERGLSAVVRGAVVHGMRMTQGCDRDTGGTEGGPIRDGQPTGKEHR